MIGKGRAGGNAHDGPNDVLFTEIIKDVIFIGDTYVDAVVVEARVDGFILHLAKEFGCSPLLSENDDFGYSPDHFDDVIFDVGT